MKALAKTKATKGLWLIDTNEPKVTKNNVKIKIHKTAICGTDLHIYNWDTWSQNNVSIPTIIGHEFYGTITEIGKNVHNLAVGDRVSGEGHITCGKCRNCMAGSKHLCKDTRGIGYHLDGAFAEYMILPASNVYKLPKNIKDNYAAILDPLGNATHTALMFNLVGEDVLITGAGAVGLMAVAIARHIGARYIVVTDINDYRLNIAKELGADYAVNIQHNNLQETMQKLNMTEGFDVALEMSGAHAAMQDIIQYTRHGAKIAMLGIPPQDMTINWNNVVFKMLTIQGIYGREIYETWYKMTSMLQSGLNLEQTITHEFPYYDYQQAFDLLIQGKAAKIILNWN